MNGDAQVPVEKTLPLSQRLWALDWQLPWTFGNVSVEPGTFAEALPFIQEHYASVFGHGSDRFLTEGMTEAKSRFWHEMDIFIFRSAGRVIGISAGHPSDWSTYYSRTLAILPDYREAGLATGFFQKLRDALSDGGVARWEGDVCPANAPMVHLFSKLGLMVTGTLSSERWGSLVRFTHFLGNDASKIYRKQFLNVPAFGRRPA